ncbi:MAG: MBL fold metallo-hydrolase [Myxococcales bacterium]|jgi:phosphoribosyl 1,2-cyclic phosphodiesterase|nr:MBL fold metallo-hydrolase [Myxococcales bacterium]
MSHPLSVRFLGVRGSVATPGVAFSSVGGNTSCVEVSAGDTRIILDAGTGLRTLGDERMAAGIRHHTLLLSHLHWDHLQGLPFFTPVYVPGHRIEIATGASGGLPLASALPSLFRAPFFPVDYGAISDQLSLRELRPNERFSIGEITVTMARLNHPDPVYGFRLEAGGHSIVYATDTEHYACVDPTLKRLAAGADILIYDSQYTPEEYPSRVGWGHSTWQAGAELARAAGVPQLVMFHHDPSRTDAQVADLEAQARRALAGTVAAREGLVLVAEQAERAAAA